MIRVLWMALPWLAISISGCVAYRAQPLQPAQSAAALRTRVLPEVSGGVWDQAGLLQAAAGSPALAEARAKLSESVAAVTTARALPDPQVSLGAEYDIAGQTTSEGSPWLWSVGTSFLLDAGLVRRLRISLADAGVRAARLDYVDGLWTLRHELRAALLTALLGAQRVGLLDDTIAGRERLLRLTQARVAAGEAAQSDRLQAELELSRARSARDDAERTRRDALAKLASLVGVPVSAFNHVSLQWSDLSAPQAPAAERLSRLSDAALLSRTDLERAVVDYDVSETQLRQQVRLQYPQVSLGPGYTYDHGVRRITVGASFSLPVLSRNRGPIAEAEARRASAGAHVLTVQAQILSEIETAQADLEVSLAALERAQAQSRAAHALADQTQRGFDLGGEDRPTLLTAQLVASAEDLAVLDALERAQTAVGALEDALRTPLSGPEMSLSLSTPRESVP
jgi:outer membrane protein TolC